MAVVSMKQLLEAGVHFGHQTRRWNPKMAKYIFTERNGIYIIDLQKTVKKLEEAYNFVRQLSESGQSLLFVGTKKQAQEAIREEATRCGQFYVNARWLGGMMTNFKTMRTRIDRLAQLRKMQEDGTFAMLPKKEVIKLQNEREKLENNLGGIREMGGIPDVMFVIDANKEELAILRDTLIGKTELEAEKRKDEVKLNPELREAYKNEGGVPFLDNQYTVYGEVVEGMDVVDAIQSSKTNKQDRPTENIVINSVEIL